jgi:transcription elongation factor GreA
MELILTRECYETLTKKVNEMKYVDLPKLSEHIDECRTIGSLDDNPEYYQSLEELDRLNKKIDELLFALNGCKIFSPSMIVEDTVMFGATVEFVNCDTDVKKKYTLVSVYDSDVEKGYISINSPFAKEMIGLHTGDYFSFRDDEYEITNICFAFQE